MVLKESIMGTPSKEHISDEDNPRTIQYLQTSNSNITETKKEVVEQNNTVQSDRNKLKKSMNLSYFSSIPIERRTRREETTASSLFKIYEPSKESIKVSLEKQGINILTLISDKISIRNNEEVVMINDLVNILTKVTQFNESELVAMLKCIVEEGGYVVVLKLMSFLSLKDVEDEEESFEELNKKMLKSDSDSDKEFNEEIHKLPEESRNIIKSLLNYMFKANKDLLSIFKKGIYQQAIAMADGEIVLDAIKAKDFYETLKNLAIVRKENKELSTLLRIHEEYPDIFVLNKLIKLIKSTISKCKTI